MHTGMAAASYIKICLLSVWLQRMNPGWRNRFPYTPLSCLQMSKSSWIETKRDADLDEAGHHIVKKVQLEPAGFTGKSRVDLVLRIIGMVAIVTPIILVYLQQKAGLDTQKAIKQLDIYSVTASELSSITRRPVTSAAFAASKEELIYNIPPKIAFLFSNSVSEEVEAINGLIPVYEAISHNTAMIDALFLHGNAAGSSICSYRQETRIAFDDSLDVQGHLTLLVENHAVVSTAARYRCCTVAAVCNSTGYAYGKIPFCFFRICR
jgi:hypothetical protein